MIKKLEWDSLFFNIPVYEIGEEFDSTKIVGELKSIQQNSVVQCKTNINCTRSIETLINNNFKIEDIGVVYSKTISNRSNELKLEFACENDEIKIHNIIHNIFTNTRFKDEYFGLNAPNKLYKYWVSAAINGQYDDCCIVSRDINDIVVGLVTVKKINNCIKIGLIAVDVDYQGTGIGRMLMQLVEMYAQRNNIKKIIVNTQYGNKASNNLYKSNGYIVDSIFYWLYLKVDNLSSDRVE